MSLIDVRTSKRKIGKTFPSSKLRFRWHLLLKAIPFTITLTVSRLSSIYRLYINAIPICVLQNHTAIHHSFSFYLLDHLFVVENSEREREAYSLSINGHKVEPLPAKPGPPAPSPPQRATPEDQPASPPSFGGCTADYLTTSKPTSFSTEAVIDPYANPQASNPFNPSEKCKESLLSPKPLEQSMLFPRTHFPHSLNSLDFVQKESVNFEPLSTPSPLRVNSICPNGSITGPVIFRAGASPYPQEEQIEPSIRLSFLPIEKGSLRLLALKSDHELSIDPRLRRSVYQCA